MQPQNNDQSNFDPNQMTPIDYLNQIAPKQPKMAGLFNLKSPLLIIAGIMVILGLIFIIISGFLKSNNGLTPDLTRLGLSLQNTKLVTTKYTASLESTNIMALNSNLEIVIDNANYGITKQLKANNITLSKADKSLISEESIASLEARLDDAKLNAVLDRTYAREMAYRLDTTITIMREIYKQTNNSDLKDFLNTTYNNIKPIETQLSNYNDQD